MWQSVTMVDSARDCNYTVAMLVARRLVLSGRVQGVGFRYFTEEAARVEGVGGWVSNRPDGSVEVLIEGDRESVARVEARVRRGPPGARVESVVADDDVPSGRTGRFEIRS
jgi:acylphosphatase